MNEELVSIIVPIYNVEEYLPRCINSILSQSYENIEIILVDDGSTDASGCICDKVEKENKKSKVIHKKNGGLSEARNYGLKCAEGKYVTFVDSDDYISPFYVEILYRMIRKYKSEISIGQYKKGEEDEFCFKKTPNICGERKNTTEALEKLLYQRGVTSSVWAKLYLKSLWSDIDFPVGMIHEDIAILYKVIGKAKDVVFGNEIIYYYYQRQNSIVNSNFRDDKMVYIKFTNECIEYVRHNFPEILNAAISRHFSACSQVLSYLPIRWSSRDSWAKIKTELKHYKFIVASDKKARIRNRLAAILCFFSEDLLWFALRLGKR